MKLKFESSGTHIQKDLLKVRFDLFPSASDKTYSMQNMIVPTEQLPQSIIDLDDGTIGNEVYHTAFKNWFRDVGKENKLSPSLCYFVTVPETCVKNDLKNYLKGLFHKDNWATLDTYLLESNRLDYLNTFNKTVTPFSQEKVKTKDIEDLIQSINLDLSDIEFEVENGNSKKLETGTINVGSGAIDRTDAGTPYTIIDKGNPAAATGTLTSVSIFVNSNLGALSMGTFYLVSGANFSTNDYEDYGNTVTGLITFTPVTIAISSGEYLGYSCTTGNVDRDDTGVNMCWYRAGDNIPCTNQTFTVYDRTYSLAGSGTESGAGWTHISKIGGVAQASISKVGGVAKASIAKIKGVAV